jgi:hypothetical protein
MAREYGSSGGHAWALYPRFASAWIAPRLVEIARNGAAGHVREPEKSPSTRPAPLAYAFDE